MDSKFAEVARWYVRGGIRVFPLAGKKPLTPNGFRDATTDSAQIDEWAKQWPDANTGITGPFVLDFDRYKPDYAGDDLLDELLANHPTPTVDTGNGGVHLWYRVPDGREFTNATGQLPRGVDVRAPFHGYVVAPPSIHPDTGKPYQFRAGLGLHQVMPAPIPPIVLELLTPPKRERRVPAGTYSYTTDLQAATDALSRLSPARCDNYEDWVRVGMALTPLGETGLRLWDEWSQRSDRYDPDACGQKWATFNGHGLTLGSLIAWANDDSPRQKAPADSGPEPAPTGMPTRRYHCTDLGNAHRLIAKHGPDLHYVYAWEKWLIWDGLRWRIDETGEIERRAKSTVAAIYAEAAAAADDDERKRIAKWAIRSENKSLIANMIALAKSEPGVAVQHEQLDADPWLLNCENGTINLQTGRLQPHDRNDLLTKLAPVAYQADAVAPTWQKFLNRIFAGDSALVEFTRRAVGYSLTADTTEQKLLFAYGAGQNGKSTFFEALSNVMGDYWQKAPTEMIMTRQQNGVPNDVARLNGARFVVCAEIEDGQRLAESRVKDLTGGDTLTARYMRAEWFDFRPTHKLWLYGNHKPQIRGTDNGIWRRIRLLPFTVTIPKNEQNRQLPALLRNEAAGILTWAVQGCLAWQHDGLTEPAAVMLATDEYRAESDIIGAFLDECTIENDLATVRASEIYSAYCTWCEDNGEHAVSNTKFGKSMAERNYEKLKSNGIWYRRIGLLRE